MNKIRLTNNNLNYFYLLFISAFLILISGLRPIGLDRDSLSYFESYTNFDSFAEINYFEKEPFFWVITYLSKLINYDSVRPLLFIYATLSIIILFAAIRKLTRYSLISLIYFSLIFFPLHTMTQIRAGLACAVFLTLIPDIADQKIKGFLLKATVATLIHYSAVAIFATYFIKAKTINLKAYIALPIIGLLISFFKEPVLFLFQIILTYLPDIFGLKLQMYIDLLDAGIGDKINLFSIYYSGLLLAYYMFIINISKFRGKYDFVFIKLLGWSLFIYYAMSFLPVVAVRVSEIFGFIIIFILASLIHRFKQQILISYTVTGFVVIVFVNNVFLHELFNF